MLYIYIFGWWIKAQPHHITQFLLSSKEWVDANKYPSDTINIIVLKLRKYMRWVDFPGINIFNEWKYKVERIVWKIYKILDRKWQKFWSTVSTYTFFTFLYLEILRYEIFFCLRNQKWLNTEFWCNTNKDFVPLTRIWLRQQKIWSLKKNLEPKFKK